MFSQTELQFPFSDINSNDFHCFLNVLIQNNRFFGNTSEVSFTLCSVSFHFADFSPFPDEMVSSCCVVGFTFPQIHVDSNATSVISVWEKRQRFDRTCFSSFLSLVVDSYFERPVLKISHMLLVEIISKIILFHSWLARFMRIPVSHTHVSPPPSSV